MSTAILWRAKLSVLLGLTKSHRFSTSPANVYSEAVYRDLVHRESRRSARSGHLCRIVVVYHTNTQGRVVPFGSELADKTISALSSRCRDTDYIGWYGQDRILGILLTALRADSAGEGCDNLKTPIIERLRSVLTFPDDHLIQIRLLELNELTAFNVADLLASFSHSTD